DPAQDEPRRDPAAAQRAARRDEPRRTAADLVRGLDLRPLAHRAARGASGHHGPLAGQRPQRRRLRRPGAPRHRVPRAARVRGRPGDPLSHRRGARAAARRVLRRSGRGASSPETRAEGPVLVLDADVDVDAAGALSMKRLSWQCAATIGWVVCLSELGRRSEILQVGAAGYALLAGAILLLLRPRVRTLSALRGPSFAFPLSFV